MSTEIENLTATSAGGRIQAAIKEFLNASTTQKSVLAQAILDSGCELNATQRGSVENSVKTSTDAITPATDVQGSAAGARMTFHLPNSEMQLGFKTISLSELAGKSPSKNASSSDALALVHLAMEALKENKHSDKLPILTTDSGLQYVTTTVEVRISIVMDDESKALRLEDNKANLLANL